MSQLFISWKQSSKLVSFAIASCQNLTMLNYPFPPLFFYLIFLCSLNYWLPGDWLLVTRTRDRLPRLQNNTEIIFMGEAPLALWSDQNIILVTIP